MRRVLTLLTVVALVLLGGMVLGLQPHATAQEATPAMEEPIYEEAFLPVTFALGVELPSPADIFVARISLEAGQGFPLEESDPSSGMCLVDSGTITVQADAAVTVTRGATLLDSMMAAEESGDLSGAMEMIPAGEAVTLETGDAAYIPGSINGEIRNDGDEPAVCLAFVIGPAMGMMAEATPEP
jgi:quercetin dioxygenase-like cupin family protein